jgi:hypothetical protein
MTARLILTFIIRRRGGPRMRTRHEKDILHGTAPVVQVFPHPPVKRGGGTEQDSQTSPLELAHPKVSPPGSAIETAPDFQ